MGTTNLKIYPSDKHKIKHNLKLKCLRIEAGFNGRSKFVEALNAFLVENEIDYRIGDSAYNNCERGVTTNIPLKTAYYISKFLNCPIEVFVD